MEELIIKFINGNLTKMEENVLQSWVRQDEKNRKIFENLVGAWKLSPEKIAQTKERILSKITEEKLRQPSTNHFVKWKFIFRIAAVFLIGGGLALSTWVFSNFPIDQNESNLTAESIVIIEKVTAYGQKLSIKLPDGSVVKLNGGSKLTYPSKFSIESREVALTGEAFFDVARDEQRPFLITTKDVSVKVLGTSFNIKTYPNEASVVAVKSGSVSVKGMTKSSGLILKPYEMVIYTSEDNLLKQETMEDDQLIFGWINQKLVFSDTEIAQVLLVLTRWYDLEFILEKELDDQKHFTANYDNETLKTVLESLSYAYNFEYELKGKKVFIK